MRREKCGLLPLWNPDKVQHGLEDSIMPQVITKWVLSPESNYCSGLPPLFFHKILGFRGEFTWRLLAGMGVGGLLKTRSLQSMCMVAVQKDHTCFFPCRKKKCTRQSFGSTPSSVSSSRQDSVKDGVPVLCLRPW